MSRKDIILICVIVNAGLLAILFATAIIYDPGKLSDQVDLSLLPSPIEAKVSLPSQQHSPIVVAGPTGDEVDNVLNSYVYTAPYSHIDNSSDLFVSESRLPSSLDDEDDTQPETIYTPTNGYVEVTVKRGDVLERIARANGTTVSAIKKINQLSNERLHIGQVLKIPIQKESGQGNSNQVSPPTRKMPERKESESLPADAQYYVIQSGDNPWKIAKQFNVKFEDILRLNNLDEEKARNLKVGDKIRVK